MFKKENRQSLNQMNLIAIVFAGVFAFSSAFIVIFNELLEFEKDLKKTEKDFLQNQKRKIVDEVKVLSRFIEYKNKKLKANFSKAIAEEIKVLVDYGGKSNYVFVYDSKGNIIYETFPHSKKNIYNFLKIAKDGGGFVEFSTFNKIQNIAYVKHLNGVDWVIGSGVRIDDIDKLLSQKREQHKNKISGFILKIITLTLFLYLASIVKYRYITEKITKEIKFIVESLKRASKEYEPIDREKIKFTEFREITAHVNQMILEIRKKQRELREINQNLERIISEKTKKLEESVAYTKELLKEQDKFLKNAIHEINTPLSIILMNIDLYNLKYDKNRYLNKIEAAVKVLENIYGDLSFIVKKDKIDSNLDIINFSDFVKNRVEYFDEVAKGNSLSIKSSIEDDIYVLFNEFELQRLCDNNISNAIKYSFQEESIYVKLYRNGDSVTFEVENKGEEIKNPQKLFDRYYREDDARGGFGIGLNIVYDICKKNRIRIEVYSQDNVTKFKYFFNISKEV